MPQVVDNKTNVSNENHEKYMGRSHKSGLLDVRRNPIITWNQKVQNTELEKFQNLIEKKYKKCFDVIESIRNFVIVNTCTSASYGQLSRASYWDLHKWSIENYVTFWEEIWHFFHVICSKSYDKVFVKTGPGFLDNEWFSGARFNFAENILRYRDDRIALMYIDVSGNEESVTFAGMFEEVKLYAAAFRKNGLKKGDVVACYMSHRKEAIYTMLAATSIGAIFGGPSPFLGGKYVSNIVNMMDAKFLITIDYHEDAYLDEMIQMKMLKHIPIIPDKCPTLEKVILLVTQKETYAKDLSNIRNCVFLEDFLKDGRNPDGTVPDIIFEQLPFSHPICINFTSGTTGLPKAPIHSAGTLISHFRDLGIHLNLKTGDTVAQMYSVGWAVWDYFIPTLALGIKYFLYCSSVFCKFNGKTFWDMMAKYNVKFTLMATSCVEYMEKMGIEPSPGTNLDCLEIVGVGSSPVKKESFEYLQNRVKKDLFIVSLYGATEVFGAFAGCNLNMPVYAGEIQTFSLATDVKCFDEAGKSVIGKKGELVVCTPSPAFPTGLWKDENNIRLHEAYLSKYEGVWCQNDYCWINPKTKGLIVIGRSDDTIIQNDERFSAGVIYFAIHSLKELEDYICVGQRRDNGDSRAILFVKMQKAYTLMPEMKSKIEKCIEKELNVDFIPECIVEVPEIPYNINNKRMESVVRKIVAKNEIPEVMNIKNPESLKHFLNIPEVMCYNEI